METSFNSQQIPILSSNPAKQAVSNVAQPDSQVNRL